VQDLRPDTNPTRERGAIIMICHRARTLHDRPGGRSLGLWAYLECDRCRSVGAALPCRAEALDSEIRELRSLGQAAGWAFVLDSNRFTINPETRQPDTLHGMDYCPGCLGRTAEAWSEPS
jgi:hypothetical protein